MHTELCGLKPGNTRVYSRPECTRSCEFHSVKFELLADYWRRICTLHSRHAEFFSTKFRRLACRVFCIFAYFPPSPFSKRRSTGFDPETPAPISSGLAWCESDGLPFLFRFLKCLPPPLSGRLIAPFRGVKLLGRFHSPKSKFAKRSTLNV